MLSFNRFCGRIFALACVVSTFGLTLHAQRSPLTTHVPKMIAEGRAQRVQPLAGSETLDLVVSLPLRNQAGLDALTADLYNPASPNYRHWLTPAQFDASFGPTASDFAALQQWASQSGLTITFAAGNLRVLQVRGDVTTVNRALHVQMTQYHDKIANRDFHAPDREPVLDLNVPVLAISGLDTSNPRVNYHTKQPATPESSLPTYITRPAPGSSLPASPAAIKGSGPGNTYLPSDMRAAYYGTGSLTGTGQSVAIFSYDGYLASDVTLWHSKTSTTSTVPITNELTGGFDGGCELDSPCDDGEQVIDIVQVQGMAPGLSHIYFYEGLSATTELNQMASDNLAKSISCSWGGGDFGPASDPAFQQMAVQGQTYFNATGDSGAFNGFTYLPPSSDPYIVEVGGTDLLTTAAGGPWSSETAWVDSGGGFFDPNITIPTWQQTSGVITSTNKGSTIARNSPDIAAEANFDNTVASNGTFSSGEGGTSYAAPRMAGYLALVNQQAVANGLPTVGFINAALYKFGLSSTASTVYHDITSGTNPSASAPSVTYTSGAGYDLVTGWGSPNGTGLLNALIGPDFSLVTPGPVVVNRSSSKPVTVSIAGINGFAGTPTFTATGLPTGVTVSFGTSSSSSVLMTLTSAATTKLGTVTVTITGTYNSVSRSTTFQLNTGKRANDDFTISATAASAAQLASGSSTITVTPGAGLAGPVSLAVSGLPTGVTASFSAVSTYSQSIVTFTPTISSPTGTFVVTVTGTAGGALSESTTVALTIVPVASVLLDGGFEGDSTPWVFTSTTTGGAYLCNEGCGFFQHSGTNFAYLNGFGATDTDTLTQSFTITAGKTTATLNMWLLVYSADTSTVAKDDTFTVAVLNSSGTVLGTLATFSNLDKASVYSLHSYDMSAYIGQTVTLRFQGIENNSKATAFLIDDVSVVVQ